MSHAPRPRLFVISSRSDILAGVEAAARDLDPRPEVGGIVGRRADLTASDLVLVDAGEPGATHAFLRSHMGPEPRLVALLDGALVRRFGDALTGDWYDYLFYPISRPELGLVWRRHLSTESAPTLTLDVDEEGRIRLTMPSLVEILRPAVDRLVEAGRLLAGLDSDAAFRVRVALGEAVANAILYGSGENEDGLVRIELETSGDELRVKVMDEGPGFDPAAVPDPTAQTGIERNRGRGLLLMRTLSDDVRFSEEGNAVTLVFRGALDPVARLAPLLGPFGELTGLRFRVERDSRAGPESVFDRLDPPGASRRGDGELEVRTVGGAPGVRLVYHRGPDPRGGGTDPARTAELLAGLLEVLADTDAQREHWIRRRLRRERVLAELEVARDLQLRLLPAADGFADLAAVAARCDPALSLGGDFYYLCRQPDGCLGVMLGDVSSHGPSAALIMALTLSAAAMVTRATTSPAAVLGGMQEQLLRALESTEMYMTLFYGVVDPGRERVGFANAGHPYAYRVGASLERLAALDPPIGMSAPPTYAEQTLEWARGGDTLLLFTDGLTTDLSDPLESPVSPLRAVFHAGLRDPARLVEALFEGVVDDMRLDDRTAVAVRP